MEKRLALLRQLIGSEEQGELSDELALALLKTAGNAVLNRLYPFGWIDEEVPARYHVLQVRLAMEEWAKMGAEGQTYHAENGVTRTWESAGDSSSLLRQVLPYVGGVKGSDDMRDLRRNTQIVWYCRETGTMERLDDQGNRTGELEPLWSELEEMRACVSPQRGDAEATFFGQELQYDRVMSTADPHCLVDEYSVLWVDHDPVTQSYDYVVAAKARWKNSSVYAIRKVDVDGDEDVPDQPGPVEPEPDDPGAETV